MEGAATSDNELRNTTFDLVASGGVFDTDWGPIGLAVGLQQREDRALSIQDGQLRAGGTAELSFTTYGWTSFEAERDIDPISGAETWDAFLAGESAEQAETVSLLA